MPVFARNAPWALVLMCLALWIAGNEASAIPIQDDAQGFWEDGYEDTSGVNAALSSNWRHDAAGRFVTVAELAAGPAQVVTESIAPVSLSGWGHVYLRFTASQANAVRVWFTPAGGVETALTLASSDLAGYTARASLAGFGTPDSGIVRVELAGTAGQPLPTLQGLRVTWQPSSVVRLAYTVPESTCSGADMDFRLKVSVSYVPVHGLVVWAPLPEAALPMDLMSAGVSLPSQLTFVSASGDGKYTASELTVDGQTVPAHSVYWSIGTKPAGNTFILSFRVRPPADMPDGTVYSGRAYAAAGNALSFATGEGVTTITSWASPYVYKTVGGGAYRLFEQWRAYPDATLRINVTAGNFSGTAPAQCGATEWSVVVFDELAAFQALSPFDPANLMISAGGQYTEAGLTVGVGHGKTAVVPPKSVYWVLGDLGIGASRSMWYEVTLAGEPPLQLGDELEACATLVSGFKPRSPDAGPGCLSVFVGIPEFPDGAYALGDRIRGSEQINAINNDNRFLYVTYNDMITFISLTVNRGASALADVVMMQRVPDKTVLVGTYLPALTDYRTYYYWNAGSGDPSGSEFAVDNPPPLLSDGALQPGWFEQAPVPLDQIKWVGFRIPQLASYYFGAGEGGVAGPWSVRGEVTVRVDEPDDLASCPEFTVESHGSFETHGYIPLDGTVQPVTSVIRVHEVEPVQVISKKPNLSSFHVLCSPGAIEGSGEVACAALISNQQEGGVEADTAYDVEVTFNIPAVSINGVLTYLPFQDIVSDGGRVDFSGLPSKVRVYYDILMPLGTKQPVLTLRVPEGLVDNTSFSVGASVTGQDDACGPTNGGSLASVVVRTSPYLQVSKNVNLSVAGPGSVLRYELTVVNTGVGVSTKTWVVDRIPQGTSFVGAVPFDGEVWISDRLPPDLPEQLTPEVLFDDALVRSLFVPATASGGELVAPAGMNVTYVAFLVDRAVMQPPQFPTAAPQMLVFSVQLDADLAARTIIPNEAMVFSSELAQSIGNRVRTIVFTRPSILVSGTCAPVITAGETHDYVWSYRNDSASAADSATLTVTVPDGSTCRSVSHTWIPNRSGLPVLTPSCSMMSDGLLTLDLTPSGFPLASLQGGIVTVRVDASSDSETGTFVTGSVMGAASGLGETGEPVSFSATAECRSLVLNSDVTLRKVVDLAAPRTGEAVSFSLLVANVAGHAAAGVTVHDYLPEGLSYVPGSTVLVTPGWTLGASSDPLVEATSYEGRSVTKLTWLGLKATDLPTGVLPAASEDVRITFQATVDALVLSGTEMTNCAEIATTTAEDDVLPNADCTTVRVPWPDLFVRKIGPAVATSGDKVTYTLLYGNNSRQGAEGVTLIERLPVDPLLGPQSTYVVTRVSRGEKLWFFAAVGGANPPALVSGDDAANLAAGWLSSLTAVSGGVMGLTHVGIDVGAIGPEAGAFRVEVDLAMTSPASGQNLQPGSSLTNCVSISSNTGEESETDNSSCVVTRTPDADLEVERSCDPDTAYPGTVPGGTVSTVWTVRNVGSVPVYGIRLMLSRSDGVSFVADDGARVTIFDERGEPARPIDLDGASISGDLAWERDGDLYVLGGRLPDGISQPYYRAIGLKPGQWLRLATSNRVDDTVENGTWIEHEATVATDDRADLPPGQPGVEETVSENNTTSCTTVAYRADLVVDKSVANASLPNASSADAGDVLTYRISYDNRGGTSAAGVMMEDSLPSGVALFPASFEGLPQDARVAFDDGQGSFDYVPVANPDPGIRAFRVALDEPLQAPPGGTYVLEGAAGFGMGTFDGTAFVNDVVRPTRPRQSTYVSPVMPPIDDGDVIRWDHLVLSGVFEDDDGSVVFDILDAASSQPILGMTDLQPDSAGILSLADLDPGTYPRIRLRARYTTKLGNMGVLLRVYSTSASTVDSNPLWVEVDTGSSHFCARRFDGSVWCQGDNALGQLGDGTNTRRDTLARVSGGLSFKSLAGHDQDHNCGQVQDGRLFCWGNNWIGQCGMGSYSGWGGAGQLVPVAVLTDITDWTQMDIQTFGTSAVRADGSIYQWGNWGSACYWGWGCPDTVPTQRLGGYDWKNVTGWNGGFFGVKTNGTFFWWGGRYTSGDIWQFGTDSDWLDGGYDSYGGNHSCYRKTDHSLWCWGNNSTGMIGNGKYENVEYGTPVRVGTSNDWLAVELGPTAVCGIKNGGELWCWGQGMGSASPRRVGSDSDWISVSPGGYKQSNGNRYPRTYGVRATGIGPNPATLERVVTVFKSTKTPGFEYQVQVLDQCQTLVHNEVDARTTTSEVLQDNNAAFVDMAVNTADLEVRLTAEPAVAGLGDSLTYSVTVTNLGPRTARSVNFSWMPPVGTSGSPSTVNLGELLPSQSWSRKYTVTVTTDVAGTPLVGLASVRTATIDCNESNDVTRAIAVVGSYPNLAVVKTGPANAGINEEVTYTLAYGNNGNAGMSGVMLADLMPVGWTYVSSSITPASTTSEEVAWDLGYLTSGTTGSLTVTLRAPGCELAGAMFENRAEIHGTDSEALLTDNESLSETFVDRPDEVLDLTVLPDLTEVLTNEEVGFTLHFRNKGTVRITGARLEAGIAAGTTFVEGSASAGGFRDSERLVWDIGDIEPGQYGAVRFAVRTGAVAPATVTFAARMTGDNICPHAVDVTPVTVLAELGLRVLKGSDRSAACALSGDRVTWTVTVTNPNATATNEVGVTDTIPVGSTYVSDSLTGEGGSGAAVPVLTWQIGTLAPGTGRAVGFGTTVTAADGRLLRNEAVVTGYGMADGMAMAEVRLDCDGSMVLERDTLDGCLTPASEVDVTITYTNRTGVEVTNAVVTDRLSAGLEFVLSRDGGAFDAARGEVRFDGTTTPSLQRITAGVRGVLHYRVRVAEGVPGGSLLYGRASMWGTGMTPQVSNLSGAFVLDQDCSDGNQCTRDACSVTTGACVNPDNPDGTVCDLDSNGCTYHDVCKRGTCTAGPFPCDDAKWCTEDSCESTGVDSYVCTNAPRDERCFVDARCVQNGTGCDNDNNGCTVNDACQEGYCVAGERDTCNDDDGCTNDECRSIGVNTRECVHSDVVCNDGFDCTVNRCRSTGDLTHVCEHPIIAGYCLIEDHCYTKWQQAAVDPGCRACVPEDSQTNWSHALDYTTCDADQDGCTLNDHCRSGVCVTGPNADCEDGIACTADLCINQGMNQYACEHAIVPGNCLIVGNCYVDGEHNPGNGCQTCVIAHTSTDWTAREDGATCDADHDGCTVGDACAGGLCRAGPRDDCKDDRLCTADRCVSDGADGRRCEHALLSGWCLVEDRCFGPGDVDVFNPCRACDPAASTSVLTPIADGTECDADHDGCTIDDACLAGACLPGDMADCDDLLTCTADSCMSLGDAAFACDHALLPLKCLVGGVCLDIGDANPDNLCEVCNPLDSEAEWTVLPDGTECGRLNPCLTEGTCRRGWCEAGDPVVCPAQDICHEDAVCDMATGLCVADFRPGLPLELTSTILDVTSPDGSSVEPQDVNVHGLTVGWTGVGAKARAFWWTVVDGMNDMGGPLLAETRAYGVNDSGRAVGTIGDGTTTRAFWWTRTAGLMPHGEVSTAAETPVAGPSADGAFAYPTPDGTAVVVFGAGNEATIPRFEGLAWVHPIAVADGVFVAGVTGGNEMPSRAFLWHSISGSRLLPLPDGATSSTVADVNASGRVAGTALDAYGKGRAFVAHPNGETWVTDALQVLCTAADDEVLCGDESSAAAINDAGQIAGWADDASGARQAVLWTNGAPLRNVGAAIAGAWSSEAMAVSQDGLVTGIATFPDGRQQAFVWVPSFGATLIGDPSDTMSMEGSAANGRLAGSRSTNGISSGFVTMAPRVTCGDCIVDTVPPEITCAPTAILTTDDERCGVDGTDLSFTVSDRCTAADLVMISGGPGDTLPVGTRSVTWVAMDLDGNTAHCTTVVTVKDGMPPVIDCDPSMQVDTPPDRCGFVGAMTAQVFDACDGTDTMTIAAREYPVGVTDAFFESTDAAGNLAYCTTRITVTDRIPPTVQCNTAGLGAALPPQVVTATGQDACGVTVTVSAARCEGAGNASLDQGCVIETTGPNLVIQGVPPGAIGVTWTALAVDNSGNRAEAHCSLPVTAPPANQDVMGDDSVAFYCTDEGCEQVAALNLHGTGCAASPSAGDGAWMGVLMLLAAGLGMARRCTTTKRRGKCVQ